MKAREKGSVSWKQQVVPQNRTDGEITQGIRWGVQDVTTADTHVHWALTKHYAVYVQKGDFQ